MKCLNCGKELINVQTKYCSASCQQAYQSYQKILEWKAGTFNGMSGKYGLSKIIRKYMLEKANYKCELCSWGKENLYTGKIPLEIHHINGDYTDNSEQNLQVLCPNCHSLTSTYKALNKNGREERKEYINRKERKVCLDCGTPISDLATRCRSCEGKTRIELPPISREELKQLIRTLPFTTIGKKYNVSDNTIKKWCDKYNLPRLKKEINKISDTEWELI